MSLSFLEILIIGLVIFVAVKLANSRAASAGVVVGGMVLLGVVAAVAVFIGSAFYVSLAHDREAAQAATAMAQEAHDRAAAEVLLSDASDPGSSQRVDEEIVLDESEPANSRPTWLDEPAGMQGYRYHKVITIGPYATRDECDRQRDAAIRDALCVYADRYLGTELGARMPVSTQLIEDVAAAQWQEELHLSIGPMYQLHVRLLIDDDARAQLAELGRQVEVKRRLGYTGALTGGVLLALGLLFGFLKLDTAMRGNYPRRLRLAAGGAILAVVTGAAVLAIYAMRLASWDGSML